MTYTYTDIGMHHAQRRHTARQILNFIKYNGALDTNSLNHIEMPVVKHLELAGVVKMHDNLIDLIIADKAKAAFLMGGC